MSSAPPTNAAPFSWATLAWLAFCSEKQETTLHILKIWFWARPSLAGLLPMSFITVVNMHVEVTTHNLCSLTGILIKPCSQVSVRQTAHSLQTGWQIKNKKKGASAAHLNHVQTILKQFINSRQSIGYEIKSQWGWRGGRREEKSLPQ